ncbi:S8 family serine peptidase [Marinicella gelatinilytica]|uniref:S8 family serine peptidase n=1 Tax=Marinicella gelatinilytica TaxID=2996017 RepID=UPI002260A1F2|nr:S8 family serine peptidase [Marinicella gelatinilytica]MCX7545494.1 S8 family serine peptidase [Marinicella gelatinilytica]
MKIKQQILKPTLLMSALGLAMSHSVMASELKDQLIIKYKDSDISYIQQSDNNINHLSVLTGVSLMHHRYMYNDAQVVKLDKDYSDKELQDILAKIKQDSSVEYVEEDKRLYRFATADDSYYEDQWHYYEAVGGINLEAGWDVSTGLGVTVAVIDTGYRPHVDLNANIVGGYDMMSDVFMANDGDGRDADASDPGDWMSAGECGNGYPPQNQNSSWHGTHVAGTISAVTNNNQGVAGIAYDAKVVPVRVLGKCGGLMSDIADAMVWASGGTVTGVPNNANPAQVLNLSLGGQGSCSSTSQNAIDAAVANGSVVVVASGNSNANVSGYNPGNCDNVISVAATDRNANRASYSNYGALIDIAAPGGGGGNGVLSTLNSGTSAPGNDNYAFYQGTSMAAPHVAGVAGLMYSVNPALTPAEVEAAIKVSARSFPSGSSCSTSNCGDGLLDAAAALAVINVGPQLTANSTNLEVCSNQSSIDYVLNLTDFTGSTNMSVSGCPSAAACNFSVNPVVSPANTTNLTVGNIQSVTAGQYNLTATGTDSVNSSETDDEALTLSVLNFPAMPGLNSPADDSYAGSFSPTLSWSSNFGTDFLIEVDDDPGFGSVDFSGNTSNGVTEVTTSQLNPESCYYWRVTPSNVCGNGSTSLSRRFYTGTGQNTGEIPSTDVPKAIIDNSSNISTLNISGVGVLSDVNVLNLSGTHPWMADVEIELTSPEGTTVKIMTSSCGSSDNFDLNFDDEATPGNWPCPPTDGGTYQPSNLLSAFDGENADGTWILTVYDIEDLLGGNLISWGLEFESFADTGNHCAVANVDPTAVNDTVTLTEDDPATMLNVLANDTDPDGGQMDIMGVTQGSHGTVVNQTSSVTYAPNADFCGSDSFTYTLNGGSTATVNVTVNCVNDQPSMTANKAVYMPLDLVANPASQTVVCQMDMGNVPENNSQQVNDMLVNIDADPNGVLTSVDVDNSGQMSYVFTGQSGQALVSVSMQDNGGTANGGNDTTEPHSITIHVHDYLFLDGFDKQACE